MGINFSTTRNIELSTLDYLSTQIPLSWTNVTVVKGFQQAYKETLPVVSIRLASKDSTRKEIGNTDLRSVYTVIVDLFCTSDGMRLDLSDFILGLLKVGFTYYEFSHESGDNRTLVKTANGRLTVEEFLEDAKVDFGEDVASHDRFRHVISFNVRR